MITTIKKIIYSRSPKFAQKIFSPKTVTVNGKKYLVYDEPFSSMHLDFKKTIEKNRYNIDDLDLPPKSVIFDIGANIGMISVFLAQKFPQATIYAFEPLEKNFKNLLNNLDLNQVKNVYPINKAVSADGRPIEMCVDYLGMSGGGTACIADIQKAKFDHFRVESITLDEFTRKNNIKKIDLLKIDCEGSEYDILYGFHKLDQVKNLIGEFHINSHLREQGYDPEQLKQYCQNKIGNERVRAFWINMAE